MGLLDAFLSVGRNPQRRTAIVRVEYGRLGQVLAAKIKLSSGDPNMDARAIEHVKNTPHATLHHPGKDKKRRINQWYDVRYFEGR